MAGTPNVSAIRSIPTERTSSMKTAFRKTLSILLSVLILAAATAPSFAAPSAKLDYAAFGDSVAAGVRGGISELSSDYGYTDLIASDLRAEGALGDFSEAFCTSGMTAKQLAANTAVLKDTSSSAYKLVKNAELATLTIAIELHRQLDGP